MLRPTLAALALVAGACGTDPPVWTPDAGPCVQYSVPMSEDLMAPSVSFHTDVMKVFNDSCGSSACHGSQDNPTGSVFLGASTANGSDSATVFTSIVSISSGELRSMNFVTPSDPSMSYLMHKLDGDQCVFEQSCTGGDCMHSMPSDSAVTLAVTTRDIVRRWIAQGAPNN
jgi:hypothetical protein